LKDYVRKREDDGTEQVEVNEGSVIERKLFLTPKTMMLFDIAKSDGYPGNLSEYMNECVDKFYKTKNLTLAVVQRKEL